MEISFPVLDKINAKDYGGPIKLLSFLDTSATDALIANYPSKYPCGHRDPKKMVFRPPKVLMPWLRAGGLLADLTVFKNVVVFDLQVSELFLAGHRERKLCPQCFFKKALDELAPTCPICRQRLHNGQRVQLVKYEILNIAQKKTIKHLRVNGGRAGYAVCCCGEFSGKDVSGENYRWDRKAREPRKV
ncbi:MAG: hypothetical protein ACOYUZ_01465 [Patescibacteria group bacterium]